LEKHKSSRKENAIAVPVDEKIWHLPTPENSINKPTISIVLATKGDKLALL
jgi:hypothetical protein